MPDNIEEKVFGPSTTAYALVLLSGAVLFGFGVFILLGQLSTWHNLLGYGLIVGSLYLIGISSSDYLNKQPKIILSTNGIEFNRTGDKQFYRWQDVGLFVLITQQIRFNTFRYACAYTDVNHDALKQNHSPRYPSLYDADIQISLSNLAVGRSEKNATELVNEINDWREKYGSLDNDALHLSTEEIELLKNTKDKRKLWSKIGLISLCFAVPVAKYYLED